MDTIGSTKLKNSLNAYLKKVSMGHRYIISDRGRPVAKLLPLAANENISNDEIITELIAKKLISISDFGSKNDINKKPEFRISLREKNSSDLLIEDRK